MCSVIEFGGKVYILNGSQFNVAGLSDVLRLTNVICGAITLAAVSTPPVEKCAAVSPAAVVRPPQVNGPVDRKPVDVSAAFVSTPLETMAPLMTIDPATVTGPADDNEDANTVPPLVM